MNPIQKLMLSMFIHLRIGVGVIGLSLPFVLVFGGKIMHVSFAGSMSAYYHATPQCALPNCSDAVINPNCLEQGRGPMRNWFVGNLFFVGAAMFLMKGFSQWEDWALNIAGIAAPCVALFPMEWPCRTPGLTYHSVHFPAAITFFVCAGFTCIFCSNKTLAQIPNDPQHRRGIKIFRMTYLVLGVAMFVLPVIAWFVAYNSSHKGFWLEAAGVGAFGIYWLAKTIELKWSDVERRAFMGVLAMNPRTLLR
jgi:hypothetical protein